MKRHEQAQMIPCACGCDKTLKEYDQWGNKRTHVKGHGHKAPPGHVPKIVREAKMILCGCGCSQTMLDRNKYGYKRKYILGHSGRDYPVIPTASTTKVLSTTPGAIRERKRGWAYKVTVLRAYGGDPPRCACCGETRIKFLAIDHINGGGAKHLKTLGVKGGQSWYKWLIRHEFPPGLRVLCHNCNLAIGFWGQCPHQEEDPCGGGSGWEQINGFAGARG